MDELWFTQLESKVFSQIEYMLKGRADAPYPTLNCTTVNQTAMPTELPTLYVRELNPVERGQDLDNARINAVLHTVEIQAWTDKGQSDCKGILVAALVEMKRLRYDIVMMPTVQTQSGIAWGAFRARRLIGADDTF